MTDLRLTQRERQTLLEILEAKQRELSLESRRTESFKMHGEMRERLRTVDRMIERLTESAIPGADGKTSAAGARLAPEAQLRGEANDSLRRDDNRSS